MQPDTHMGEGAMTMKEANDQDAAHPARAERLQSLRIRRRQARAGVLFSLAGHFLLLGLAVIAGIRSSRLTTQISAMESALQGPAASDS